MRKIRVFISSVQTEFAKDRQMLYDYLMTDALLGRFFEPFIFEKLPASNRRADQVYLVEARNCDIYLGLFGKEYGHKDEKGSSPTEHEYAVATEHNRFRLIFLTQHLMDERHPKEQQFIRKVEQEVVRKKFASEIELKAGVYSALIKYLEEKEYIRSGPFDASICAGANMDDLDDEKIAEFVRMAKKKRGFPLPDTSLSDKVLTHLNLFKENDLTNAAVLLFGKQPQRFIISSEVKCAQFHGNEIVKPVPAYQVYKGDVFQLVNQAVDFVLSRIDAAVSVRDENIQAQLEYEIPRAVITEAIVNAIAHRDYTSNGSVQVMLFRNRIEIWNPGELPHNLTIAKLKKPHASFPANLLLAEPLYLAGYIERLGTGIPDMLELCHEVGLREPDFKQEDMFKTIIWRKEQATGQVTGQVTGQATGQAIDTVMRVLLVMEGKMKRAEIQEKLGLKHREHFADYYLNPAMENGFVEMTYPDKPKHPDQHYQLTEKGLELKRELNQG